ncbi:MAG: GGDEF domain-containing protein, partial [Lachnospiraceae bacterium]|nr:GGDEF domain-containing protein [Lachnospiraceae bacterium]
MDNVKTGNGIKGDSRVISYVGLGLMLLAFILAVVVTNTAGSEYFTENIIMTIAMAAAVIITVSGYLTIAVIVSAFATVVFAGLKIYSIITLGRDFPPISFLWILLPAACVVGIALYVKRYTPLTLENALLKKQIAELVMIDPVTGLYNMRSMFMDIQTQISYSERNNSPISLMIIRLRYPAEMRKVLKPSQYEKVVKQLSLLLVDTVRLEDRVYSLDENGGFGIILTCDREGTRIVEGRLRKKLDDPKWFEGVSDKQIRTEVKIGFLQYDKSKYNRNANEFKDDVEEEVNYDM